jgi:hypothetical protein
VFSRIRSLICTLLRNRVRITRRLLGRRIARRSLLRRIARRLLYRRVARRSLHHRIIRRSIYRRIVRRSLFRRIAFRSLRRRIVCSSRSLDSMYAWSEMFFIQIRPVIRVRMSWTLPEPLLQAIFDPYLCICFWMQSAFHAARLHLDHVMPLTPNYGAWSQICLNIQGQKCRKRFHLIW